MGMWGSLFKAAKGIGGLAAKAEGAISHIPGIKMLPGVGNLISAADLAVNAYQMFSPSSPAPIKAMNMSDAGGLPALPGMQNSLVAPAGMPGSPLAPIPGSVSGRTGHYASLASKPVMIPQGSPLLRAFVRAPRGYHVFHTAAGVVAIRKDQARSWAAANGLPPPPIHHKPPISVGDWHRFKAAGKVMKKLQKIEHEARAIVNKSPAHFKHKGKEIVVRGTHAPGCGCFACKKRIAK